MIKVFLDTNILVDYVDNRDQRNFSRFIIELGKNGEVELCASYLTYANMAYILRNRPNKYSLLQQARKDITVLMPTLTQLDYALENEVKDFEDLLQYQCAVEGGCDVIISNNTKDFKEFCTLPLFTSEDFVVNWLTNV